MSLTLISVVVSSLYYRFVCFVFFVLFFVFVVVVVGINTNVKCVLPYVLFYRIYVHLEVA